MSVWRLLGLAGGLFSAVLPAAFAGYLFLVTPPPHRLGSLPLVFALAAAPVVALQRKVHGLRSEVDELREAVARLPQARPAGSGGPDTEPEGVLSRGHF